MFSSFRFIFNLILILPVRSNDGVKNSTNDRLYPYLVVIHRLKSNKLDYTCTGSLLSGSLVLSAAQCVVDYTTELLYPARMFTIFAGMENSTDTTNIQSRKISKINVHPEYNRKTNNNDISILVLSSILNYNGKIKPVQLSSPNIFIIYDPAEYYTPNDCFTPILNNSSKYIIQYPIQLLNNTECEQFLPNHLTDHQICSNFCSINTGSPLICKHSQIGIVSSGINCDKNTSFGIITRLDKYHRWIRSIQTENNIIDREIDQLDDITHVYFFDMNARNDQNVNFINTFLYQTFIIFSLISNT